ncbi:enolase N-terminal-like fold-containing protein [Campylobacter sp.]|uniref:enolase N-terminal-like fold-containing protein n=1 Tax=Campylobacter sp. TaxID=205 RepID=UPI00361CD2D0
MVGLFFTGVKPSNGVCGVSYTPLKSFLRAVCCALQTMIMPNFGNICGKNVKTLLKGSN